MVTLDLSKRKREFTCSLSEVIISHDNESGSIYENVALTMPDDKSLRLIYFVFRRYVITTPFLKVLKFE